METDNFIMNTIINTANNSKPVMNAKEKKMMKKDKYLQKKMLKNKRKRDSNMNTQRKQFNNNSQNKFQYKNEQENEIDDNNNQDKVMKEDNEKVQYNPDNLNKQIKNDVMEKINEKLSKNKEDKSSNNSNKKYNKNFNSIYINEPPNSEQVNKTFSNQKDRGLRNDNEDSEIQLQNMNNPSKRQKLSENEKIKKIVHKNELTKQINEEIKQIENKNTRDPKILSDDTNNKTNLNEIDIKKSVFSIKTFSDLDISQYLKNQLQKNKYETMTKIQKKSIPILLKHKNVIVKSETGSGKTLAYVIPLYEQLININQSEGKINRKNGIYAIIFSPTHELCIQIENTLNKLSSCCINVVYGTLMGGQKIEREKQKLRKGLNVLICTPGRLLYHLKNTKGMNFSNLRMIIFDEADMLLTMGFEKDIKLCFMEIFKKNKITEGYNSNENQDKENGENEGDVELNSDMFKKYKIFLISATIDNKIRKMTDYLMKGFKTVGFETLKKITKEEKNINDDPNNNLNDEDNENTCTPNEVEAMNQEDSDDENVTAATGINQYYSFINDEFRLINLLAFLYNNKNKKIIIFVSTCSCVNFLNNLLSEISIDQNYSMDPKNDNPKSKKNQLVSSSNLANNANYVKLISQSIYQLHGKMKHDERTKIFNSFNKDNNSILISTDVAARGLDFPNVDWVIHYDINPNLKEYINRMGRTARLDKGGNSLMFLMENERVLLDKNFKNFKGQIKEILSSNILLEFVKNINNDGLLKNKIEMKPMSFEDEVDQNEKFRKKYIFCVLPLQKCIKNFIMGSHENLLLARNAFKSEVRAYVTFMRYQKNVFNVKSLNLTRLSRSFGLYKESTKIKVGKDEVVVDYMYEKNNVKAEKKYSSKKIENKLIYSEFQ